MATERPRTVGELRASGYRIESVKDEMRRNLIAKIQAGETLFPDIIGYEETVVPQVHNAVLSRHDILFLGLRGQAKTRMLRQLVRLLDDAIPVVAGSEVHDHPYAPLSKEARDKVAVLGDGTPIEWVGREERYHEKLATPDVTIADLIGEVDMIKHAEGRYLSSELTMHFGLIPRTNRGIFCINELPDLAPKIQVGLFNVLEERDVQIRGYPVRLNLDLCMVFSANPEDYTNRGRIVTPLKDRIGSVVRTHYPLTRELGIAISDRNAWLDRADSRLAIPLYVKEIVEEISRLARTSPHVNQQSGVSVRMSIANLENVVSNAERRALLNREGLRPVARLPQLARQARADAVGGRGPRRQGDRPDRRRSRQECLCTTPRRPRVPSGGRLFRVGPGRRGRRYALGPRDPGAHRESTGPAEASRRARPSAPSRPARDRGPRRRDRQRRRVHPRRAARP
jgi:magnesium chelatase subunit I